MKRRRVVRETPFRLAALANFIDAARMELLRRADLAAEAADART
jgi:hypothetical protein